MYHAPVSLDLDQQEEEPVEALDEGVGPDTGSDRLREAHLHNGQARARALFAPWFAITAVGAALLVGWSLYGSERLELIVGWISLVAFANWTTCRRAIEAGSSSGSRSARGGSNVRAIAEAVGLAGLWAALPAYAFATQAHEVQVVIGGAMGAMIIAAIALSAVPAAASAWIVTMTAALCAAY